MVSTSVAMADGADAGGVYDERSLAGDKEVVRARRELAVGASRARQALQHALDAILSLRYSKGKAPDGFG